MCVYGCVYDVIQCLHVMRPDFTFDQSEHVITLLSIIVSVCVCE